MRVLILSLNLRRCAVAGITLILVSLVLLLFIALASSGCGMSALEQLGVVNTSAKVLTDTVIPPWDQKCLDEAKACAVSGCHQPACCPKLTSCQDARAAFYIAVRAVHSGVAAAAPLAVQGDEAGAKTWLLKVAASLDAARKAAQAAGLLGGAR